MQYQNWVKYSHIPICFHCSSNNSANTILTYLGNEHTAGSWRVHFSNKLLGNAFPFTKPDATVHCWYSGRDHWCSQISRSPWYFSVSDRHSSQAKKGEVPGTKWLVSLSFSVSFAVVTLKDIRARWHSYKMEIRSWECNSVVGHYPAAKPWAHYPALKIYRAPK